MAAQTVAHGLQGVEFFELVIERLGLLLEFRLDLAVLLLDRIELLGGVLDGSVLVQGPLVKVHDRLHHLSDVTRTEGLNDLGR